MHQWLGALDMIYHAKALKVTSVILNISSTHLQDNLINPSPNPFTYILIKYKMFIFFLSVLLNLPYVIFIYLFHSLLHARTPKYQKVIDNISI